MNERDGRKLRTFFREIHERFDPPAPPFAGLIRSASEGRRPRPWRVGVAIAAAASFLVGAVSIALIMHGGFRSVPGDDDLLSLAAELSHWEAPTDFLLHTPGIEYLHASPSFGTSTEALPGDDEMLMPEASEC